MKTNRNKFLHHNSKFSYTEQIAVVIPHLHFDLFLQEIYEKVQPMTVICVCDGKQPQIDGFLYVSGEGSFAKSSNIGIAYAQSMGFSYVCLINDDIKITKEQIRDLFVRLDDQTVLVSPYILENKNVCKGIFINNKMGYIKCISNDMTISMQKENTVAHLGTCMLFRSSFRLDDRFPHGIEDIEFSMRLQKYYKTKIVSNVLVVHQGQSTISKYSYQQEKTSLEGKIIFFDPQIKYRIVLGSILHVLFRGSNKRERFRAIRDVVVKH